MIVQLTASQVLQAARVRLSSMSSTQLREVAAENRDRNGLAAAQHLDLLTLSEGLDSGLRA